MLGALEESAIRTILLGAVVQFGTVLFRAKQPQFLLIAWTVVLAASLAMPALQRTTLQLPIIPSLRSAHLLEVVPPWQQPAATQAPGVMLLGDIDEPPTMGPSLKAVYLVIAGALLLRLAIGVALSLRLLGRAVPARMDGATRAHVRISPDITAPVTIANVILLPADAWDWSASMRQAVLAHERAHVARWDFAMLLASQVNQAVFWFSPLSWWLHRRLAALAELASDDKAMEITGDRPGYAEVLLEMGRRSGPLPRGLAMARPATLRYRIERILSDRAKPNPVSPIQQVSLAIVAAIVSMAIASLQSRSPPLSDPASPAGLRQPSLPADLDSSPWANADLSEPTPASPPRTEVASQAPPQPMQVIPVAMASPSETVRVAARTASRVKPRLYAHPPSALVERVHALSDPAPREGLRGPNPAILASATATSPSPASETSTVEPAGKFSCAAVYRPGPGRPVADGLLDLVQAKYFRAADGTSWLKLLIGSRTKAKLSGQEVEVTSVRMTALTVLPRGTDHSAGTIQGPHGTIDFDCRGFDAHL